MKRESRKKIIIPFIVVTDNDPIFFHNAFKFRKEFGRSGDGGRWEVDG